MDKRKQRQELAKCYKCMIGKTFRHFKGGLYEVVDIAVHSENAGVLVIYKSKKYPTLVWARPLDMFLSDVDKENFTVYNDDKSVDMIPFDEAIETVYALLGKIMEEKE